MISEDLNSPWNSVKRSIKEWLAHGSMQTSRRRRRLAKMKRERKRGRLCGEESGGCFGGVAGLSVNGQLPSNQL